MNKLFEVHPKRPIIGVLPNNKRITGPTRLYLNRAEFLRCINNATLYAVVGEDRVLVRERDYDKALALFDKHVEYKTTQVKLQDKIPVRDSVQVNNKPAADSLKVTTQKENTKPVNNTPVKQEKKENTNTQTPQQSKPAQVKIPQPPVVECDINDESKEEKKENNNTQTPQQSKPTQVSVSKNK